MEFKYGDECFYKNKKASFISYLPTNEAVIEIYAGYGDDDDYVSIQDSIVVPKEKVTLKPLIKDEAFDDLRRELQLEKDKKTKELNAEISLLRTQKNEIEKQLKKYEGTSFLLDYINGEALFGVTERHYRGEIVEVSKMVTNDEPYRRKLRSFSIQRDREAINTYGEFCFYVSSYESYSNDSERCWLFKTKEDALPKLIQVMLKNTDYVDRKKLEFYGIKEPKLWEAVEKQEAYAAKKKQEEIIKAEESLKRLRGEL